MASKVKMLADGFVNVLKGIGGEKDARGYTTYQGGLTVNYQIANDLYTFNWLAAKVVDIPVDDATRKWRSLLIPDAEKKKEIEDAMKEYDVRTKFNAALKWARVFGGSALVVVVDDGVTPQEEPLIIENIKQGSLKNILVLDRYNIYPDRINWDITDTNYGKPEFYTIARSGQRIHQSRVIRFEGAVSTTKELEQQSFWGHSIFTKGWEPISNSQIVSGSIANLVMESNVDVYRIAGLNALIAEGRDDLVVSRLRIAGQMKSIINGIALDREDEYDKKTNNFASLPEIDDRFIQKVAGCYNIPVTKLIGISPSGMNATGESDLQNYDDSVQSLQENVIRPRLDIVDRVVMASQFGKEETFEYIFKPLKQLTEIEQSDVDVKRKDRDIAYLDAGIIESSDILANLAEYGTYVAIDENRVEAEKAAEELTFGEEEENENNFPGAQSESAGTPVSERAE